jgi:hypothetical protein
MEESTKLPDSALLVTINVAQLRELVRDEITQCATDRSAQERLLDINEAAKVLSASPDWLYRNSKRLPFTRKLGPKMLRSARKGLQSGSQLDA